MRSLPARLLTLIASAFVAISAAQAATIQLVTGTAEAQLHEPFGAEHDAAGNLFIVEMMSGNRLLKLDANGALTHIAGVEGAGDGTNDGPALAARFKGPHNLQVLPDGDVLIADTWNGIIRRFKVADGTISTVAGFGVPDTKARSSGPYCIALDPAGKQLYIADLLRVHAVDLATGKARVVAGNGSKGKPQDGAVATESPLADPRAVAVDRAGNVYILERGGNALRVVDSAGKIRTVVDVAGKVGATGDGGPGVDATMNGPKFICIDKDDSVLIADAENHLVRRYSPKDGTISRVAGTGKKGAAGVGGDPLECQLNRPHGVSVEPKTGDIFITDSYNNRVLKIVR